MSETQRRQINRRSVGRPRKLPPYKPRPVKGPLNPNRPVKRTENLGKLRYPLDLAPSENDFIQFVHFPYKPNDIGFSNAAAENAASRSNYGSNIIQLYMPNSTPGTNGLQQWTGKTFPGELGKVFADRAAGMGRGTGGLKGTGTDVDYVEAAKQGVLEAQAAFIGQDAATALQLGRGQVYNPNIEMMYKGPDPRGFRFDFNFMPKNAAEAAAVDDIIYEFKFWSSPSLLEKSFMSIPDMWSIKYFEAPGKAFARLNKFKNCVLESVVVKENPLSDFHMTIDDPAGAVPVQTSISLNFKEVDIVTQQDHTLSRLEYRRGM